MRHLRTVFAVIGAATVLVLAANTVALAATGQALLLGKSNSANTVTAVKRTTSGSVLKLETATSTSAPLTVTGKGKVTNLNADQVDGLDSASLKTSARVYSKVVNVSSPASGFTVTTPTIPAGTYAGSVNGFIYGPTTGTGMDCYFYPSLGGDLREVWIPVNAQGFYGIQITGAITLSSAQAVEMHCTGPSSTYVSYSGSPLQISLTKLDTVTTGSLAKPVARTAPRGARR